MWINLKKEQKRQLVKQTSIACNLPDFAIEKDWWVCLLLKAIFQSKYANFVFFKGGTSLSKAYNLIERFSEDVDLIIDRKLLGFDVVTSKTTVKKIRKAAGNFIIHEFREELINQLNVLGVPSHSYTIKYNSYVDDTSDPCTLEVHYQSENPVTNSYISKKVLLEIGARSLTEPVEIKTIVSLLDQQYSSSAFSIHPFMVRTVLPTRTFLEKILLLHEEFAKPIERIRTERLTRHLYDLEKMMQSVYGPLALVDDELFTSIVEYRKIMTPVRGIDYVNHEKGKLRILPPQEVVSSWKSDYKAMQENMIIGRSLDWEELIQKIKEMENQLNKRLE